MTEDPPETASRAPAGPPKEAPPPLPLETRKVQTIRGSTHLISLPKRWVDQVGIHAGTALAFKPLPDGSMLLIPPSERPRPNLQFELTLDPGAPEEALRSVIGAYLAGYQTIRVRSMGGNVDSLAEAVQRACDRARGLVVVERTRDHFTLQDLLDPMEFNARKGIQRLHYEARAMLLDACRSVTGEPGAPTLETLERRDDELDRILFILVKQQNLLMRDLSFSERVGIPLEESLNYLQVAQYLERVGDYAVRLARYHELGPRLRSGSHAAQVRAACDLAVKTVDDAVAAFQRRDVQLAHETIRLCLKVGQLAAAVPLELVSSPARPKVLPTCQLCLAFSHVFESFERVGLYAKSIAEVAINQAMSQSQALPGAHGRGRSS